MMPGQLNVVDLKQLDAEIGTLWYSREADPIIARIVLYQRDKEQHDLLIRYVTEKIGELAHAERKL